MKRLLLVLLFLAFCAFAQNPSPNCGPQALVFTAATSGASLNTTSGGCTGAIGWWLTWSSTGFTGYTIALQGSQDGTTWANINSALIQQGTANPTTWTSSTTTDAIIALVSLPYIRINVSSVTGTGTIKTQLLGYVGTLALSTTGGGGGGGSITLTGDVSGSGSGTITTTLLKIHPYTVATLPNSPTTGYVAYVTDGASSSDCTIGGGSNKVLCAYNGSAWAFPGPTSGGSGVTVQSGGVSQGTATTLNFNTNLTASVAGGVATINATGGGGGTETVIGTADVFISGGAISSSRLTGVISSVAYVSAGTYTVSFTGLSNTSVTPLISYGGQNGGNFAIPFVLYPINTSSWTINACRTSDNCGAFADIPSFHLVVFQ